MMSSMAGRGKPLLEVTIDGAKILHEVDANGREVVRRDGWQLGLEVRHARERLGLTQAAAVKECSFSGNAWSTLEAGLAAANNNPGRHRSVGSSESVVREAAKVLKQPAAVRDRWLQLAGHQSPASAPTHKPAGSVAKARTRAQGAIPSDREILNMLAAIPEYARVPLIETIFAVYKLAVDRDYAAGE